MAHVFSSIVAAPPERVWEYFASPGAFRRLSPAFQILKPQIEAQSLRDGRAVLAPSLALPGLAGRVLGPRWVARHQPAGYREGRDFEDRCTSAPYRQVTGWRHVHELRDATGPDGECWTEVRDELHARLPRRAVASVFAYRHRQLAADLEASARIEAGAGRSPGDAPLTVAVTGASGLIGTQLCAVLGTSGHRVVRLVRGRPEGPDQRRWDPAAPAADLLEGVDVLVHLAGSSVAGRFTAAHKRSVRSSRIEPTRALAELVAARGGRTQLVCASAIGYYGPDRGDAQLSESAAPGTGTLADIVVDWEAACEPARAAGARVVTVRTGLALSAGGGLLPVLLPLYRAGLGGRLGSGQQWMSWIALDDLTDIFHRAVVDGAVSGPVNATAPVVVRNSEFTRVLASVLRRPALLPVPPIGPALLLGAEGARETALADQRVVPTALVALGHRFRYPDLRSALRHELGRESMPDRAGLAAVGPA